MDSDAVSEPDLTTTRGLEGSDVGRLRRARAMRRALLVALAAFIGLGTTGMLGVRVGEARASGGGYVLRVTYAHVTRPGLATPWSVEVTRPGGFDGPVTVATTASYFEIFDENSLDPDPARATAEGDAIVWEFDPPPGDTLTIDFDARAEPTYHGGRSAVTSVRENGRDVVSVRYRTRVMP